MALRNPYSQDADDRDLPYSRAALVAALDAPTPAPPLPPPPGPALRSPGARSGAARRGSLAPEPAPAAAPDGWTGRVGSSAGDMRDVGDTSWQRREVSSFEPPDDSGFDKAVEKPDDDPYRVTSGFDPSSGKRMPIGRGERTPTTPYTYEDFMDSDGARLTDQREDDDVFATAAGGADRALRGVMGDTGVGGGAEDGDADRSAVPAPPARGAVARPTFRPGAAAVGQGQSYFENVISHNVEPESYLPGYNPREAAREYDGGKQAPQPDQLSPQMQSVIRGAYGLDVNGLSEENLQDLIARGWVYGDTAPPGYEYSDDGLIKKSGSVLKTIGRIAAIALPVVVTIATGGVTSPWLAAAIGAGSGAGSAALAGGDTSDILTGAGLGAASGGLGAAGAGLSTGARMATQAGLGAAGGALTGGGVPGALLGAGVGAAGARFGTAGLPPTTGQAVTDAAIDAGLWGVESALAPGDIGSVDPETGAAMTGQPPRHGAPAVPPAGTPTSPTPPPSGTLPAPPAGGQGPTPGFLSPEELAAVGAESAAQAGPLGAPVAPMEGFNLEREQDPSFSVKDAFAAAVRAPNVPPPPGEDKAALGEWFSQHIAPSIEAQGHTVNWVDGDKVNITGPQGTGTIDWYRGAGAAGGALAWQPEGGEGAGGGEGGGVSGTSGATSIQDAYSWLKANADPSWSRSEMEAAVTAAFGEVPGFEKAYAGDVVINGRKIDLITDFEGGNPSWSDNLSFVPLHPGGSGAPTAGATGLTGGGAGLAGYANLAPGVQLAAPLGRSDVLQQIMEEIRRIQSGAPPREALLAELGAE